METPVLLIIFNRADTTRRVFDEIRKARPARLYIAADGPREHVAADEAKCRETREIAASVDWECEVRTLFRKENLGGKWAIIEALNWFFTHEEEGIVLEDDCLPSPDFFTFCTAMLNMYRNNHRVMHIGGTNLQFGKQRGTASYYFSRIASIWGWASWKRVWQQCDHHMKNFPRFQEEDQMSNIFPDERIANWTTGVLQQVYEGHLQTWDFPLGFHIICHHGLCVCPNVNLVSNIGFGASATRTKNTRSVHANIRNGSLREIVHPTHFVPDLEADQYQLSLSIDQK